MNKSNVTNVRSRYLELQVSIQKLLERVSELDRHVYDHARKHRQQLNEMAHDAVGT